MIADDGRAYRLQVNVNEWNLMIAARSPTHSSMRVCRKFWATIGALALLVSPFADAVTEPFLEAQEAFRRGNVVKFEAAAAKLKQHPLTPYIEYYRWRMNLDQMDAARTDALIGKYSADALAETIRADWLKYLARNRRWESFNESWPKLGSPDPELRCLALEARRQRPDPVLVSESRELWRTLVDLPEGCDSYFRVAFDLNLLSEDDIWARTRRQFETGRYAHGRKALTYLPKGQQVDDRVWAALNNKTAVFLDGIVANPKLGDRNRELAVLAIIRLARQTPGDAADYVGRLGSRMPAEETSYLWGVIATQAALGHQPEALAWFSRARGATLGEEQQRWAVRAGLRAGDWKQVRQAIEVMSPTLAEEPAWVYWQGRALKSEGKAEAATLLWGKIAEQPHFYGLLAAEELGRRFSLPPQAPTPTAEELAEVGSSGAVKRALAFLKLDLRTEGIREWNWALRGMTDRQLLAAAEYARRQHVYDRAISAADRTQNEHDYSLRYLTPYEDKVRPAARAQKIDDAWVYGLMRQESRFITGAKSSVGAQGLMQVMPATGRWVARKAGMNGYQPSKIAEIDTNVALGTIYLRMVQDSLDGHPVLASAAYNAGPGRARKWRDPVRTLEGAVYAETIPFNETRDYVKKVMANAVIYSTLLNGKPDSLKARLGVVKSAASSAPPDEDLP